MSSFVRQRLFASVVVLGPLALSACPPPRPLPTNEFTPECAEEFRYSYELLQLQASRDVDVLFVIDNSLSMAQAQVKLVEAAGALFERLDAVEANYRIAFTTTDDGNPWCPMGTPESGTLVLSSCEARLDQFLVDSVDVRDSACSDPCSLDAAALTVQPTSTTWEPTPEARPWLERIEGVTNLPTTTDMVEAFRCFAPQGIDGCGFESPLESLYLALHRIETATEPSYGFMRAESVLAMVLLTDEDDCSYNDAWAEIFAADGSKTFWSDPSALAPSSALCWNAGVECTGDPSGYDGCEPVNKTIDGDAGASPADAVLHSVSRYIGHLDDIERQKQEFVAQREHVLALIAGVEGGGENWSVTYADAQDPAYQLEFGIGPGCTSDIGEMAVPPVRTRALAEEIDPLGLHSICDASFETAMAGLGDRIAAQFRPLCFHQCAADADLSTSQLEPSCTVEQSIPGAEETELMLECERDEDGTYLIDAATGTYQLPDSADVCFATLVDPDGSATLDPNDNLSQACRDDNFNLEFELVRRRGIPAREGTSIVPICEVSECPDVDCPGIGG
jgi:hypothetical protein